MNTDIDSLGIGKALTLFPEQIKTTYEQAISSNIEKIDDYSNVVISGMGGSSNAGKIVQSLLEKDSDKMVFVFNDYGLPSWVNERTLVVLNSYSGNTEETLSAYEIAKKEGCKVIGICTGGKIAEMIKSGEINGAIVAPKDTNPSNYPKSGLGLSLGALIGSLTNVGLIKITKDELCGSLDELISIRSSWNVEEMAKWSEGYFPVFFAARPFLGPLNAGRNACCEIGRVYTQFYDFPEMNHVLIEALSEPIDAKKNKYIFFESDLDNERIIMRYKITKELMEEQGLTYKSYKLAGKSFLVQCLEIAHYGAWLGYYYSMLRNEDPGPEPWIIKLKESLSQPVH